MSFFEGRPTEKEKCSVGCSGFFCHLKCFQYVTHADPSSMCLSSCMDSTNVGYDSDETNARSISSMSNRSSPLSWRHGQSSPRLQAGDAPSSTGGGYQGAKTGSQYTAHTMPARCSSRLSSTSRIELIEGLDADDTDLKSGYLSDTDLLGKSLPDDDDDNLANG